MKQQGVLLSENFDGLKPDKTHTTPRIWIEEIRVYKAFNPELLQKEYTLQRGLNILWADPGEGKAELYAAGISGHAAGKTTFCRLLRYLLGEPVPGTERFRQKLVEWEPNAVLIGKLWLDGVPWIVCRPLGLDKRDFALKSERIENVFENQTGAIDYSVFFDRLEAVGLGTLQNSLLPFGGAPLSWRRLLPWLSRDQECRLGKLSVWRDPVTESQTPETTLTDACYIIRRVMGLISDTEENAQIKHRQTIENRKELEHDLPLQKYRLKQDEQRLAEWGKDNVLSGDSLFLSKLEAELKAKLSEELWSDDLKALKKTAEDAEQAMLKAQAKWNFAQAHHNEQLELLESDRAKLAALKGETERVKARQDMEANAPAVSNRCNVPLWIAEKKGCMLAQAARTDFESNRNILKFDEQLALYEEQIQRMEQSIAVSEGNLNRLEQVFLSSRVEHQRSLKVYLALRSHEDQEKGQVRHQLKEISIFTKAQKRADQDEAHLEQLKKAERESNEQLNQLRRKADAQKMRVNELFEDIVRAVLGKQISATFAAQSDRIDLNVEYNGSRESSATDTVQILAFDLAALLLGAENRGCHPGILIHDSPREADMAKDIYHRFFLYMENAEKAFAGNAPNYQYIITTTEPPPAHLQKKPWLIKKLDASKPKERLLGVDL